MGAEIFRQLAYRLIFKEQSLGQRTKGLFQLVRQFQRQDRVNPIILQCRLRINPVPRHFQQSRELPAQVFLRLLGQALCIHPGAGHRLFHVRFGCHGGDA
jgi:hypothetical protein